MRGLLHRRVIASIWPVVTPVLPVCVLALGCLAAAACANKSNPNGAPASTGRPPAAPVVSPPTAPNPPRVERLAVEVVNSFPHDPAAFTQGLLWSGGKLYESTGLEGRSTLRRVDLTTGRSEKLTGLPDEIFAEGLALAGDELIQLSYRNGRAFVYALPTFAKLREHPYSGEGWGLTFDGRRLVMSDGSARLVFRDPASFAAKGEITVMHAGQPVARLNELEWAEGQIFANIWMTDTIVRIDPESGEVTAHIDAAGLLAASERAGTDVLNGIAHAPERGTFFITGKLWPKLFEVRFVPR